MNGRDKNPKTPDMQHRHFAYLAHVVKTLPLDEKAKETAAWHMALELRATNPMFTPSRFMEACGFPH